MNQKLAYYENPYSPPSGNNIPARKKKSERRNIPKEDRSNSKPTRKVGSPGISHHRKSSETITYKAVRCKMDEISIMVGNHQGYGTVRDDTVYIDAPYTHSSNSRTMLLILPQHSNCRCVYSIQL